MSISLFFFSLDFPCVVLQLPIGHEPWISLSWSTIHVVTMAHSSVDIKDALHIR